MINKEEWNKLSEESKWNLYINKISNKKDELDVSELFSYFDKYITLINPYNKKQIMTYDIDGLQIASCYYVSKSNLKSKNKKAVLVDCEFDDLKVGDFFRYTYGNFRYKNTLKTKGICIITKKTGENINYMFFDKDNVIDTSDVSKIEYNIIVKLQKVVIKNINE